MSDSANTDRSTHVVASYTTYDAARRAVDFLTGKDFPVERLAIIAGDLRFVEQVTGRPGYGRAAANGASAGAVTGAVLGFVLGVFSLITPLTSGLILAMWGALLGAVIGAAVGVIGHALSAGSRTFSSVGSLQAGRYDIVAPADIAVEAQRLLVQRRGRRAA
jgi:hypothetical protein